MTKTIKQIADELKMPKQKIYRYIKKNRIKESHQKNGVMYYNETVINAIKSAFEEKSTSIEAHQESHQNSINEVVNVAVIELLKNELEYKNEQIKVLQLELKEEREHNREIDKKLLDTLTKLAESQTALTAGQTAEKQKALVEKMAEVKEKQQEETTQIIIDADIEKTDTEKEKKGFFKRMFNK